MKLFDVATLIKNSGYSWEEVKSIINRLIDQNNLPTSHPGKLKKLHEIRELLISLKIDPDEIEIEQNQQHYPV